MRALLATQTLSAAQPVTYVHVQLCGKSAVTFPRPRGYFHKVQLGVAAAINTQSIPSEWL